MKDMAVVERATTYPQHSKLLEREVDKLLREPERQANIRKVERLIETHVAEPPSSRKRPNPADE